MVKKQSASEMNSKLTLLLVVAITCSYSQVLGDHLESNGW